MINSVRNTVLSIISKDNNGYITPDEFNHFAKQAQLEIFNTLVFDYNNAITKQNARMSGSDYADLAGRIEQFIDTFVKTGSMTYNAGIFTAPVDMYMFNSVIYNGSTKVEKVHHNKIHGLLMSNLTNPTESYPMFTLSEDRTIKVYPSTIQSNVEMNYVRYPKDPKWTYVTFTNGTPLFDGGALDYQDFELPQSYESELVLKILQYAGVSIRDGEVTQAAKAEELQNKQTNQ